MRFLNVYVGDFSILELHIAIESQWKDLFGQTIGLLYEKIVHMFHFR